jgi:enamine deaminase RidA (YjgF/YER057c/UK114 family)
MEFINPSKTFPFSDAVIYSGRVLETVITGIPDGAEYPVPGGVEAELREIFRQLDEIMAQVGIQKTAIASVRLYLADVLAEIGVVNAIYKEYFGSHPPNRRAYGVTLQRGMRIEAAFTAELPPV